METPPQKKEGKNYTICRVKLFFGKSWVIRIFGDFEVPFRVFLFGYHPSLRLGFRATPQKYVRDHHWIHIQSIFKPFDPLVSIVFATCLKAEPHFSSSRFSEIGLNEYVSSSVLFPFIVWDRSFSTSHKPFEHFTKPNLLNGRINTSTYRLWIGWTAKELLRIQRASSVQNLCYIHPSGQFIINP